MMKKVPIALQLSIIFLMAFLLTSLLLGVFIPRRLDEMYEDTVYDRLEAEGKAIRLAREKEGFETAENIAYIRYIKAENIYEESANIMPYIDDEAANLLIGKALAQSTYQARYKNTVNGEEVYYIALNYQSVLDVKEDVFIIMADSSMKEDLSRATTHQIYIVNVIAFGLGYIIIVIWIIKFLGDTRKISEALKRMGEDHYRKSITTRRRDEMGELVANIESMRLKIIANERLRQEIIQGVSHDLKTPIALISSYAEAYKDGMCDADEMADIAKKETGRLNSKVSKLLNLTRLGYIDKNFKTSEKTDMKKLVSELIRLYDYQDKIEIAADLKDCEFAGDRESWFIAVQNILDNAMRYAKSNISVGLTWEKLEIANDGRLIEESVLPIIFEAYEKGADGISGIGLSIVRRTVEMFGYCVRAENTVDGVSFIIFVDRRHN